jgi:hypothetical protein
MIIFFVLYIYMLLDIADFLPSQPKTKEFTINRDDIWFGNKRETVDYKQFIQQKYKFYDEDFTTLLCRILQRDKSLPTEKELRNLHKKQLKKYLKNKKKYN